jgi:hypothetical protein
MYPYLASKGILDFRSPPYSPRGERMAANTMWKTAFGNGRRSPLVTDNAPVTDQVLQRSQER